MSIDDDSFNDMDAAAGAMAYQLEQLEEANRTQWAEVEEEREKLRASEVTLKDLQKRVPYEQLELLRARQGGDAHEATRYLNLYWPFLRKSITLLLIRRVFLDSGQA